MARQQKNSSAKSTRIRIGYLVILLGVVGCALLVYMFRKITEEAIYADQTRTSGAMSAFDITGSIVAFALIVTGLVAFYWTFVKDTRQHKKANKPLARIKIWSLWSLIVSCASLFFYMLAVPAIALGIIVFMFAADIDKVERANVRIYIGAGTFAIVNTVVHYLIISAIK